MESRDHLITPDEERKVFEIGKKIGAYTVIRLIGQGGYGDIYEVSHDDSEDSDIKKNIEDHERYAMKVEYISSPKQALAYEKNILKKLQDSHYFPHLFNYGIELSFHYLVMDLLGPSLSSTRRQLPNHKYSLFTALRLSVFMLQCIEHLHRHGYVHCDIKPGNFLLRSHLYHNIVNSDNFCDPKTKRKSSNLNLVMTDSPIVLIDYGLSRQFIDPNKNAPFPDRGEGGFVGTTKYASLNVHQGSDVSPRDDIISWIYSTVEMVDGKLPWSKTTELKKTKILKTVIPSGKLLESLPSQFIDIFSYAKNLSYSDTPNYNLIYNLLNEAITKISDPTELPFDWEEFDDAKIQSFSPIDTLPKASDIQLFPEKLPESRDKSTQSACCLLL